MPARLERSGAELQEWLARRERHKQKMEQAKAVVRALSGHALLRKWEVAAMLGTTPKKVLHMEKRGELPPRVTVSSQIFGWHLKDIEAMLGANKADTEEAA